MPQNDIPDQSKKTVASKIKFHDTVKNKTSSFLLFIEFEILLVDWASDWVLEEVLLRAEFLQQHLLAPAVTKLQPHLEQSLQENETGIRKGRQCSHRHQLQSRHFGKKEKLHTSSLQIKFISTWLPSRSEKSSLNSFNHQCSRITIARIYHTTPMNTAKNISPEHVF